MSPTELRQLPHEPEQFPEPLRALWWEARGEWEQAHKMVQHDPSTEAAHVHAYLHRKEGDLKNARFWYEVAKVKPASGSFEQEWDSLAEKLLCPTGQLGAEDR